MIFQKTHINKNPKDLNNPNNLYDLNAPNDLNDPNDPKDFKDFKDPNDFNDHHPTASVGRRLCVTPHAEPGEACGATKQTKAEASVGRRFTPPTYPPDIPHPQGRPTPPYHFAK